MATSKTRAGASLVKPGKDSAMSPDSAIVEKPLEPHRAAMIVGASRGFGAALARKLAAEGYQLGLLSRDEEQLKALADEIHSDFGVIVFPYRHDVKNTLEIPGLLQQATRQLGRLDLFIYVAGIMYPQDAERFEANEDVETLQVNLVGAAAWLTPVAERFQRAGRGQIVGVGSIAGVRGRRALPAYSASKAGLHTYLEGLRNRLSRHGVTVTTLKPGQIATDMLAHAAKVRGPVTAERAAELAWRAIKGRRQVAYIPSRWALIGLVVRHIPSLIFRRMNL
jgi:short-subunit dehydrogenase